MGNDFNILEYADPELDNFTGGEKTNILDENLDLEEEDNKEDQKNIKRESDSKERYLNYSLLINKLISFEISTSP